MLDNLKQIFVGKKYSKFEKKVFSFPAFFFGPTYFAYRKMLLVAIILSILLNIFYSLVLKLLTGGMAILAYFCIQLSLGLYFPLWYRSFYNNSVNKIMQNSSGKSEESLINEVQKKGGTSIGIMILFIIINAIILNTFSLDNLSNTQKGNISNNNVSTNIESNIASVENNTIDENNVTSDNSSSNCTLIEKVKLYGYSSGGIEGQETLSELFIVDMNVDKNTFINDYETYSCSQEIFDSINFTSDYDVYLNLYVTNEEKPQVLDFTIFNKKTNEELTDITDENSLREKLGLYVEGDYEEELTFISNESNSFGVPGAPGVSFSSNDEDSYSYYDLLFRKSDNTDLLLEYRVYVNEESRLEEFVENQKYKIKFNVIKDTFEYDHVIVEFEPI